MEGGLRKNVRNSEGFGIKGRAEGGLQKNVRN